jgi:hypothetical protein
MISHWVNKIAIALLLAAVLMSHNSCCKASRKNIEIGMTENKVKSFLGEPDYATTVSVMDLPKPVQSHFSPSTKAAKMVVYQCTLLSDLYIFYDDLNVVTFTAEGEHGSME